MSMKVGMVCCSLVACAMMSFAQEGNVNEVSSASEVKAAPGAILMAWKGSDTTEAELAAFVDKGEVFDIVNSKADVSAANADNKTIRWSGILNVSEPGLYTFNATFAPAGYIKKTVFSLSVNNTKVFEANQRGTMSKNVMLPGPVNIDVEMYVSNNADNSSKAILRFKKAGTLKYTEIKPAMLYHTEQ